MPMPNRRFGVNGYRYGFQGQEVDPETGKPAFQLRLWDGRIGRWLTTDPYRQYHSPYLGMGNNPMNGVDPDGGLFGRIRAWIHKQFNGGEIFQHEGTGKWQWMKSFNQSDYGNDGIVNLNGADLKSFGYGGFGNFTSTLTTSLETKVDFGLVLSKDKGLSGYKLKGPTITLYEGKSGYEDMDRINENYYLGKGGILKGNIYSASVETGIVDLKQKESWETSISVWGATTKRTVVGGFGSPLTELKVKAISQKGISVHYGLQEEIGESIPLYGLIGIAGQVGFRIQGNLKWEW